jgi:acyl-CoA thioester hydrolase
MAEAANGIQCGLAVVHPWLCDAMGHLSTRHYLGMFDDAAYQLFGSLGYDPKAAVSEGWGWADVRHEIDYRAELGAGAVVHILGRVTALGRTSVTVEYCLVDRHEDRLCAQLTARSVCFDLRERKAMPLPAALAAEATALFGLAARSG